MAATRGGRAHRDTIERAALELLEAGGPSAVTTRAVAAAAEVQSVTIYRAYGDMERLLDAAVQRGFRQYIELKTGRARVGDPVDDLREGWDLHVGFGLEHPHLYALMYGRPNVSPPGAAAVQADTVLLGLVQAVARAGRLRTDVASAARAVHAAGCGVTLSLIGVPVDERDPQLSHRVREAVLGSLTTDVCTGSGEVTDAPAGSVHAVALAATLRDGDPSPLTEAETNLLVEWLDRLARGPGTGLVAPS
ncbi:TetR family transcriptional regulator [Modestobacter versicolor]|nr:TetR family transcriptional regulator [Modestobacter versicolor]